MSLSLVVVNCFGRFLRCHHPLKPLGALIVLISFGCATLTGGATASRPSNAQIQSCILDLPTPLGSTQRALYGSITQLELGQTITSQGGMIEMAVGAPKGTKIYPTRAHFANNGLPGPPSVFDYWVFKDSFGKLQCVRR